MLSSEPRSPRNPCSCIFCMDQGVSNRRMVSYSHPPGLEPAYTGMNRSTSSRLSVLSTLTVVACLRSSVMRYSDQYRESGSIETCNGQETASRPTVDHQSNDTMLKSILIQVNILQYYLSAYLVCHCSTVSIHFPYFGGSSVIHPTQSCCRTYFAIDTVSIGHSHDISPVTSLWSPPTYDSSFAISTCRI